jgi:hypothetical protein
LKSHIRVKPNQGFTASPQDHLSAQLQELFTTLHDLRSTPKSSTRRLEQIEQKICAHIAHENEIIRLENLGEARGWPSLLNYPVLIRRVLFLKAQLLDFIRDECDLYNCVVWTYFLEMIDYEVHEFGRSEDPARAYEYAVLRARCRQ